MGDVQYHGDILSTVGDNQYRGGIMMHVGDIMSTVGGRYHDRCEDIMSTMGVFCTVEVLK